MSGPCGGDRGLQEGQQGILSPRGSDPALSDKNTWLGLGLGLPVGSQGILQPFSIGKQGWGTGYFSGCSQGLHIGEKRVTSFCQAVFEEWQQCDIAGVRSLSCCQKGKEAEPVPWAVVFKATRSRLQPVPPRLVSFMESLWVKLAGNESASRSNGSRGVELPNTRGSGRGELCHVNVPPGS